ncbi:Transcriptional regulator, LysR family [Dissulfuribacter thermophilus]|uniref:Transcriptional regulator, LysR family n=1 Tax=Dissulfuribacter thermophilus TaxID=1156395 RepID=A0A1B9F5N9_9BACT|nr:selenium metabolism-associated LysR family transcriptional regulator [Dissulfuribacter thermophilus]OCC15232.1 Transcriptional regulator, LysR family [Dissulfuribacter thermophilus]
MIDVRQLQVFLAVWKEKSFSKAAKIVFLTQPTVSGHIKALEDTLGIRLFDRAGRRIYPTKAGEILYPYAKEILNLVKQAQDEIEVFKGADTGQVYLGGSNIPGQYILPTLLGEFKREKPLIEVSLRIGDSQSISEMLLQREIDLGMVGAELPMEHLKFEPCFEDKLVFISSKERALFKNQFIDPKELVNIPFIFREKGSGTRLAIEDALKRQFGLDSSALKVVAEMGSTEAVKQAVKAGVGYAIVSERAVRDEIAYGVLKQYSIKGVELKRKFYLAWDGRRTMSPTCKALKEFILAKVQEKENN